jgi:hypothetical protein
MAGIYKEEGEGNQLYLDEASFLIVVLVGRVLRQLVEEKRHDKEVIEAEMDQMKQENKTREDQDSAKITALTR